MGLKSDFVTIGMTPARGRTAVFWGPGECRNRSETRNLGLGRSVLRSGGLLKTKMLAGFFGNPLELLQGLGYH
jgi:hypothetical protein